MSPSFSLFFLSEKNLSVCLPLSPSCINAVRCCCYLLLQARGSQVVGGWGGACVSIETRRYQHYQPHV